MPEAYGKIGFYISLSANLFMRITLIFLLAISFAVSEAQKTHFVINPENASAFISNIVTDKLKGNVESMNETSGCLDTSMCWLCNVHRQFRRYNQQGNLILYMYLQDSVVMKYNDQGHKTDETIYSTITRIAKSQMQFRYDDKGTLVERTIADLENSTKRIYKYDAGGDEIEGQDLKPDGSINSKWTVAYVYNNKGLKTKQTRIATTPEKSDTIIWQYKYDRNGNNTWFTDFGGEGFCKYDHKNRQTQYVNYNSKGVKYIDVRTKFDDRDNCIEQANYNSNNLLDGKYTFQYEYDGAGDWTKETDLYNGKIICVLNRQILYY
jgi:hypothetical protein